MSPRRRAGRDAGVDRCPSCGSWRFATRCHTCAAAARIAAAHTERDDVDHPDHPATEAS